VFEEVLGLQLVEQVHASSLKRGHLVIKERIVLKKNNKSGVFRGFRLEVYGVWFGFWIS